MRRPISRGPASAARDLLADCPTARRWVAAALVAAACANALLLGWILLLASAIDRVFIDGAVLSDLLPPLGTMAALLLLRAACLWGAETSAQRASDHLRQRARGRLTRSLVCSDPRRLGGGRVGEVSGTLVGGVEDLGTWLTDYVPAAAMAVAVPAMALAVVLVLDPPTTLILLFTGPMLVLLLALIGRRTAELTRRRFDELGWLRGFYLDMIRGLGTLKAFGRSDDGAEMIESTSRRFGDTTMEVLRTAFQTSLVMEWAATAATALVAVEVSFRLIGGSLSYGTALAVLVVTPEFFVPFRRLAVEYHAGQAGDAAATEIAHTLVAAERAVAHENADGTAADDRAVDGTTTPATPAGPVGPLRVELRGVTYTYPGSDRAALEGLHLEIGAGETLALVGPSGAGKSTVASLLLRFNDPDAGTVMVDGDDVRLSDASAWRRSVAWVPQQPTLFSGTVADNIALGEPAASRARLEAAAADAGAAPFIDALPHGYDTVLGEGGTTLSGGQRQRIAIARAFLRDAPLVVLDEFTAHLDPHTEQGVLDAAARLLEGRTALVIAHRIRTARSADRIAVLEAGRMVETGTHAALLASGGHLAVLCAEDPDSIAGSLPPHGIGAAT